MPGCVWREASYVCVHELCVVSYAWALATLPHIQSYTRLRRPRCRVAPPSRTMHARLPLPHNGSSLPIGTSGRT